MTTEKMSVDVNKLVVNYTLKSHIERYRQENPQLFK